MATHQDHDDRGWMSKLSILPPGYDSVFDSILRGISWFFMTLGLLIIVPIIILFIYDFTLWQWRLLSAKPTPLPSAADKKPRTDTVSKARVSCENDSRSTGFGEKRDGGGSIRVDRRI